MFLKRKKLFFLLAAAVVSCAEPEKTDEELMEDLHGVWEKSLVVTSDSNISPMKDSSLFFINGNRMEIRFSSKGVYQESFSKNRCTYTVKNGVLIIAANKDSMFQEIDFLNAKRLILNSGGEKVYYDKFVY